MVAPHPSESLEARQGKKKCQHISYRHVVSSGSRKVRNDLRGKWNCGVKEALRSVSKQEREKAVSEASWNRY